MKDTVAVRYGQREVEVAGSIVASARGRAGTLEFGDRPERTGMGGTLAEVVPTAAFGGLVFENTIGGRYDMTGAVGEAHPGKFRRRVLDGIEHAASLGGMRSRVAQRRERGAE